MNVKELKLILNKYDDETNIIIRGCYESEGDIERVCLKTINKNKDIVLVIDSDICSG